MTEIKSPLPGTFYHRPSPEEPIYKNSDDMVNVGDTIGLIEVMKTFIEVKAEIEGVFDNYLADDAKPVQAGDVIAALKGSS